MAAPAGRAAGIGGTGSAPFVPRGRGQPQAPVSPRLTARASPLLARSSLFSGGSSSREALIVAALLVHPELLAREAEELAEVEFEGADARSLRGALLDLAAEGGAGDAAFLDARLERPGSRRRRAGSPAWCAPATAGCSIRTPIPCGWRTRSGRP